MFEMSPFWWKMNIKNMFRYFIHYFSIAMQLSKNFNAFSSSTKAHNLKMKTNSTVRILFLTILYLVFHQKSQEFIPKFWNLTWNFRIPTLIDTWKLRSVYRSVQKKS